MALGKKVWFGKQRMVTPQLHSDCLWSCISDSQATLWTFLISRPLPSHEQCPTGTGPPLTQQGGARPSETGLFLPSPDSRRLKAESLPVQETPEVWVKGGHPSLHLPRTLDGPPHSRLSDYHTHTLWTVAEPRFMVEGNASAGAGGALQETALLSS